MKKRIEIIDGKEYVVTTIPKDRRLQPAEIKKRMTNKASRKKQLAAWRIAKRKRQKKS